MLLKTIAYEKLTKFAKAIGSENIGPQRTILAHLAPIEVNSFGAITLENKGKFWPLPQTENHFARADGGERGIRTLETVSRLHAFQACAFSHSATSPLLITCLLYTSDAADD